MTLLQFFVALSVVKSDKTIIKRFDRFFAEKTTKNDDEYCVLAFYLISQSGKGIQNFK